MRDYSIPPYSLGEIGAEVRRLGELLHIHCNLAHTPEFRAEGYVSMPTLSEDIVRMAAAYGIPMSVTNTLSQTGIQLQELITALRSRGVAID